MIIFKTFQGLENFYIKFQDFPYFSRICTNPDFTPGWGHFTYYATFPTFGQFRGSLHQL